MTFQGGFQVSKQRWCPVASDKSGDFSAVSPIFPKITLPMLLRSRAPDKNGL